MLIKLAIGRLRPDWFLWIKEHMLIQKEEEEKGIIESCDYKFFKKKIVSAPWFWLFQIYIRTEEKQSLFGY